MCFSAQASFGASAFIAVIGTVAMVKAKTIPQRFFAAIPLVFSVQQFSEGMLWLSLSGNEYTAGRSFFTYTFLVFAMMVWPVWIPLSIRLLEQDGKRKKIMNVLLIAGAVVSVCVGFVLLLYPIQVTPAHHHLHYRFDFPHPRENFIWLFDLLYFLATIATPFVSGIGRMKWLGFVFAVSCLFAFIFYNGFVVSVWCYFAAILSVVVVWIISGVNKPVL
jgi:hypothetical protein